MTNKKTGFWFSYVLAHLPKNFILDQGILLYCTAKSCLCVSLTYIAHKWMIYEKIFKYIITINVPLFKKLGDIIYFLLDNHFISHFEGYFKGVKKVKAPLKCPEKWIIK